MITRGLRPDDHAFLFDSWLRSFRASHESGPYPPDLYYPAVRTAVERILARPTARVLVAEDETTDVILGYVVHEPGWQRWSRRRRELEVYHVAHYAFVRELARGKGIGKYLLLMAGVKRDWPSSAFSFSTPAARGLMGAMARFLPDSARYPTRPTEATQGAETT